MRRPLDFVISHGVAVRERSLVGAPPVFVPASKGVVAQEDPFCFKIERTFLFLFIGENSSCSGVEIRTPIRAKRPHSAVSHDLPALFHFDSRSKRADLLPFALSPMVLQSFCTSL